MQYIVCGSTALIKRPPKGRLLEYFTDRQKNKTTRKAKKQKQKHINVTTELTYLCIQNKYPRKVGLVTSVSLTVPANGIHC